MADVRAADLPAGSVVTWGHNIYLKDDWSHAVDRPWCSAGTPRTYPDDHVDLCLAAGGKVLRYGYGEEE